MLWLLRCRARAWWPRSTERNPTEHDTLGAAAADWNQRWVLVMDTAAVAGHGKSALLVALWPRTRAPLAKPKRPVHGPLQVKFCICVAFLDSSNGMASAQAHMACGHAPTCQHAPTWPNPHACLYLVVVEFVHGRVVGGGGAHQQVGGAWGTCINRCVDYGEAKCGCSSSKRLPQRPHVPGLGFSEE